MRRGDQGANRGSTERVAEAIRAHADAATLPIDEIIAVADTVVVRPDPQPAAA